MGKRWYGCILWALAALCGEAAPEVAVEGGRVGGVSIGGLAVYKGIPFAAPPVGGLRWKAPQPVVPWKGVWNADHFRPACPQPGMGLAGMGKKSFGETSEDCLYLNVWAPEGAKEGKLPVMVWIHGGGFAVGWPGMWPYSGENLAKKGVVFVSIAYRLGALGFLAHPGLSAESGRKASGNYGIMDQIAALKWVQKNIVAFGGEPANVTIFGESAGGTSVSVLCASPLAKGLFRRAISESGASFAPVDSAQSGSAGLKSLKTAEGEGVAFAQRMGATSLAELRQMPVEAFLKDHTAGMGGFWTVCDGYVIAGDPREAYRQGNFNDVDVLIGSNSNEGAMFIRNLIPPVLFIARLRELFGPMAGEALNFYPAADASVAMQSARDLFRDAAFAWPTYTWAKLQSEKGKANVCVYYFDQRQPPRRDKVEIRGASHADEINYVFGHVEGGFNSRYTDGDRTLSRMMMDCWVSFARTGKPAAAGLPPWPRYKEGQSTVMCFRDSKASLEPQANRPQFDFMTRFFDERQNRNKGDGQP